jgi:polyisoprenoid-binding protein YceI
MRILSNLLLSTLLLSSSFSPLFAADRYRIDKSHTSVLFFINHLGYSNKMLYIKDYDGTVFFDQKKPEKSSVDIRFKPASIESGDEVLNKKLQGDEFFNVRDFPEARFVSKEIKILDKNHGIIVGDLTLLGITKPFSMQVTFNRAGVHTYTQDYVAGFSAKGKLKRSEFGMTWGIPSVGDEVEVMIEIELIRSLESKE